MMPANTCVQRNSRLSHSLSVGSRIILFWVDAHAPEEQDVYSTRLPAMFFAPGGAICVSSDIALRKERRDLLSLAINILLLRSKAQVQALAPAIGGIAVWADQQWNVIMLRAIVDVENDRHLGIETGDTERREVRFGVKHQPVSAI